MSESISKTQLLCVLFSSGQPYEYVVKTLEKIRSKHDVEVALSFFQYIALYCMQKKVGNVKLAEFILQCIEGAVLKPFKGTMTLTFGEVAESHVGMQKIGKKAKRGFSYDELLRAQQYFKDRDCDTLLVHLNQFLPESGCDAEDDKQLKKAKTDKKFQAWILVARNGVKCLTGDDKGKNILTEMLIFKWDTKLYNERRKIVQNKRARHNLNFSDKKQIANFEEGKGTTIPWEEVPILKEIRFSMVDAFGNSAKGLKCEGNMYYTPGKTGIGYHGDSERRKVIGVRLGRSMTIHYMWYYNSQPRGLNISILLNEGDVYCMGEKTVGTDWKKKKYYTLRHAAGAEKYTIKTGKIHVRDRKLLDDNPAITAGEIWYKPKKSGKNPNPKWENMTRICD